MERISFVNQEVITYPGKRGVLKNLILVCAILSTIGNLFFLLIGEFTGLFAGVILPVWLWVCALRKPAGRQELCQVPEELVQMEDGVCILIPRIDRGDQFGERSERIVCQRERIHNLIYYSENDVVEITGRPVFYFKRGEKEVVLDTEVEFDEDYELHISCNEENRTAIMNMLQNGLTRIAEQRRNFEDNL